MGSMEQVPLDFSQLQNAEAPETLERMNIAELKSRYVQSTGYEPGTRFIGKTEPELRAIYLEGIQNKEAALQRLRDIDSGYDGIGDAWSGK